MDTLNVSFAIAAKSEDDAAWTILPNTLTPIEEEVTAQLTRLADAGDSETKYTVVKIEESGVTAVGEIRWGIREL
ncbi:hypothetical protein [Pseudomonas syringae]|uniref:hypothetical protein n=1 Tax=Pseudomonas syringae TaxID=317 RepID=UPI001F38B606|nr:hypothetical protein [Pseudomonas syringae]MCF5371970.1 hypothetical protein [Pseudomonas syringae]MCF5382033.1 hypothetical protein [Pseudomonas syringae]MCF5419434.1 hypothetical protein [Pseudomonas syringae]MCF5451980.1 hypothetical protein [Pseudomonas syringae]MCF5460750.1 hypothetical protein [Pseudomonas syringae]